MKNGKLYVLNYNIKDVSAENLLTLTHSIEDAIGSHDKLIVIPNVVQLREVSTEELVEIQMYIDNILESRKTD